MLGWRAGVDQHGVVVQRLAFELVGHRQHADHVVDAEVGDRQGDLDVGLDLAVEDEIDAGGARQGVEHRLQVGFAEVQRHRFSQRRLQHRGSGISHAPHLLVEVALQAKRPCVRRVLGQHLAQPAVGLVVAALRDQRLRLVNPLLLQAHRLDGFEPGARARVAGVDADDTAVQRSGIFEFVGAARGLGARKQRTDLHIALADHQHAVLAVLGLEADALLDLQQAFFELALFDHLLAIAHELSARRASRQPQRRRKHDQEGEAPAHRPAPGAPSATTSVSFNGR